MTSRVFLYEPIKSLKIDYDDLLRFGSRIQYIFMPGGEFERSVSILDDVGFPEQVLDNLERLGYNPDSDYFVLTGQQLPVSVIAGTLASEYGQFQALAHDSRNQCYVPYLIGVPFECEVTQ